MGDIIRKSGTIRIGGQELDVELNKPPGGGVVPMIHLQNEKFRFEIPENQFLQMASCIMLARKQLDIIKGREQS